MSLMHRLHNKTPIHNSSDDELKLDDFVRHHESSSARPGWTISPLLGKDKFAIAAKNNLRIVNSEILKLLLTIAKNNGYAFLPSYGKFSEIWIVNFKHIKNDNIDSNDLAAICFGNNVEAYLESVRENIRKISAILKMQMADTLVSSDQPDSVVFEFANVCNLACPICPRNDRKIVDGLMNLSDAKKIVNDIAACNESITLYPHYLGETLIHPAFLLLIDHALEFPNLIINIVSNGILLDSQMTKELLSRPLKSFHFSLHECDTSLQKGIHPRNAISAKNVLNFLVAAEASGRRDKIYVGVSMVPTRLNDPAVEEFRSFWQDVVNSVNIYCYVNPNRTFLDPDLTKAFEGINLPCTSPWKQPVVAYDGTVLPCCWDYDHTMPMGNAFKEEFSQIFNGDGFCNLRADMLSGDLSKYPTCSTCKKWLDYLPAYPQVDMGDYGFSSNGLYLSFATKNLKAEILQSILSSMDVWGRSFVPFHKTSRWQAKKSIKSAKHI